MNNQIINIEICKSEYVDNAFNLRIGDIKGSTEISNILIDDLISDIKDEIKELIEFNSPMLSEGDRPSSINGSPSVDASSTNRVKDEFMVRWINDCIIAGETQIRKELEDYWKTMDVYSKVLDRVTKGRMSKTGYTWEAIKEVLNDIEYEKQENKSKCGITITNVKIIDLCSKCRKPTDKVPKNIYGVPYEDKDIECLNGGFGCCKGQENKSKGCGKDINKYSDFWYVCGQEQEGIVLLCPDCRKQDLSVIDKKSEQEKK
jgi:hypothetical protein